MKLDKAQLKALVQYIALIWPLVKELVKTAEESGVKGAEKLAAVRAGMDRIWNFAVNLADVWDDKVRPAVEALVTLYHVLGVFKKKA